jgi:4-hydroxy-3-methylbut-2-enyl diphosphate reductase
MMPFGAFAEIMEGIDGLIHISQISDRRIAKPSDVLTVGQTVEAKITEISAENNKVNLSIKALLAAEPADELPSEETKSEPEASATEE